MDEGWRLMKVASPLCLNTQKPSKQIPDNIQYQNTKTFLSFEF
jgi:hypothetical protein